MSFFFRCSCLQGNLRVCHGLDQTSRFSIQVFVFSTAGLFHGTSAFIGGACHGGSFSKFGTAFSSAVTLSLVLSTGVFQCGESTCKFLYSTFRFLSLRLRFFVLNSRAVTIFFILCKALCTALNFLPIVFKSRSVFFRLGTLSRYRDYRVNPCHKLADAR